MLGRIISGISVVAYAGAYVLGISYVLEMVFSADTPIIMRLAVIGMAVLAFLGGYFSEKGASGADE